MKIKAILFAALISFCLLSCDKNELTLFELESNTIEMKTGDIQSIDIKHFTPSKPKKLCD